MVNGDNHETAPHNKPFVEAVTLLQAAKNEPLAPAKLALLEQAKAAFQAIIEQYSPTVLAVNQIEVARTAYVCVIGQAVALAQTITDNEERARAMANIAEVQAGAGNRTGAHESFTQALAAAERTNDEQHVRLLADIAEARARAGDGAEALEIFAQVAELALTLTNKKQQAQVLTLIAGGQAEAGEIAQSFVVAQTIVGPCTRLHGGGWAPCKEQQVRALSAIAQELAKTGKNKQAAELALALTDEEQQVRVLARMATGIEAARATYACVIGQAVAVAQTIRDEKGRSRALVHIAVARARAGDRSGAQESFAQAIKVAQTIRDEQWTHTYRDEVLSDIALALAKAGNVEQAIELAKTIKGGWRDGALSDIAVAQAKAGDLPQALAMMQTITDTLIIGPHHSVLMVAIADAQARAGDRAGAHESFTQGLAAAQAITDEWRQVRALSDLAEVLVLIAGIQTRASST